jgi:hypothetical protein
MHFTIKHRLHRHIPFILVFFLSGCVSGLALNHIHDGFADAYGKASTDQLLLNLARLSHDEPAYFIQLGSFTGQYSVQDNVGLGNSTYAPKTGVLSLGGGIGTQVIEDPSFTFVPLQGDTFSTIFLTPIPDQIFCDFSAMGYHADVLLRTMVQSVKIESTDDGSSEFLINNPRDPSYPKFLAFCAEVNVAMKRNLLIIDQSGTDSPKKQLTLMPGGNGPSLKLSDALVSVGDSPSPAEKSLTINWRPGQSAEKEKENKAELKKKLADDCNALAADTKLADTPIISEADKKAFLAADNKAITDDFQALAKDSVSNKSEQKADDKPKSQQTPPDTQPNPSNIQPNPSNIQPNPSDIQPNPSDPLNPYPILKEMLGSKVKVTYHMRTLEGLMYAAANEEQYYKDLYNNTKPDNHHILIFERDGYHVTQNDPTKPTFDIIYPYHENKTTEKYTITIEKTTDGDNEPNDLYAEITTHDAMNNEIIHVTADDNLPNGRLKCGPILTLISYAKAPVKPYILSKLPYEGIMYTIGDPATRADERLYEPTDLPSMTNRGIFSLIAYLYAKATLNPEKLPLQQLIQLK